MAVDAGAWAPRGLRDVTTSTVTFDDVPPTRRADPGWYLERPGFAWGGIGVAAVWFGAPRRWPAHCGTPPARPPDQVALMHLGACDVALHTTLLACATPPRAIDAGQADGAAGRCSRARVRAQAADCAEQVLGTVGARPRARHRSPSTPCTPPGSPTSPSTCASTTPSATWRRSGGSGRPAAGQRDGGATA